MSADFLDTNVFVYAFDQANERKRAVAHQLIASAAEEQTGIISFQVVQETLRVLTTKARTGTGTAQALQFMDEILVPLWKVMPRPQLYRRGLAVQQRYGYSFYDSLIIAAAIEAGCDRILSEDLQHGQRIDNLVIEDPFRD